MKDQKNQLSRELLIIFSMEIYFAKMLENIGYEQSLTILLSLTDTDILKQSKFTDHEGNGIKNLALGKLHRQRRFNEYIVLSYHNSFLFLINGVSWSDRNGRSRTLKN